MSRFGTQTWNSQKMSDDDQRFVELLRPIKDLTVNWSVPLAKYLEDYYEELTELHINLDGRTTKVNFAEAALLLQGTASVYSKKVEFLWQNVLKMLDLLSSKKALEEASNTEEDKEGKKKGSAGKKQLEQQLLHHFNLVSIELSRNSDLKNEDLNFDKHQRKMTLKFIFVTPRQLIEKESKEQHKLTRVNMYNNNNSKFYDLLGHKEDFRVNSQFAMGTGMLGEELSAESELGQTSVSLCDTYSHPGDDPYDLVHDQNDLESGQNHILSDPGDDPGGAGDDPGGAGDDPGGAGDDPGGQNDLGQGQNDLEQGPGDDNLDMFDDLGAAEEVITDDDNVEKNDADAEKKKSRLEAIIEEPRAPLADPWEPIKPHEVKTVPKPVRKGRITKRPAASGAPSGVHVPKKSKSRQDSGGDSANKVKVQVPVAMFVIQEMSGSNRLGVLDDIQDEFQDLALDKSERNKEQSKKTGDPVPDDLENNNDDDGADEEVEDGFENDGGFEPIGDDWEKDTDLVLEGDQDKGKDSYEDLVMKRVASYVAQSQDYIESTDLARRVRKWHDSIAPKLDKVEARGDFDVHAYGSRILEHFDPKANNAVDFKTVAAKMDREEVSRLFLSSLMLANSGNIVLDNHPDAADQVMPMDQVQMTLLSTRLHHEELLQYTAPSQEQDKGKQRKRKKVPLEEDILEEDEEHLENMEALEAFPDSATKVSSKGASRDDAGFVVPKAVVKGAKKTKMRFTNSSSYNMKDIILLIEIFPWSLCTIMIFRYIDE